MKKNTNQRILLCLITISLFLLAGCTQLSQWANKQEVVLPESPPLATQELVKVTSMCRKEVEGLEQRSAYVPEPRKNEYDSVLRIAADNCSELEETLDRLKQATHQKEAFLQSVRHAQSTVVQNVPNSSAPTEEALFDFAEFEPDEASETQEGPLR